MLIGLLHEEAGIQCPGEVLVDVGFRKLGARELLHFHPVDVLGVVAAAYPLPEGHF